MWEMVPSLEALVQNLAPVFTQPTFHTFCQLFMGWVMCLGGRSEYRVFQAIDPADEVSRAKRHPFDRFYNFFSRAGWCVQQLAYQLAVAVVTRLNPTGKLFLVVDDTLLHKRGKHVFGLGWFRDAVASTKKRVATASGNNWVVLGLAIPVPWAPDVVLCLPLLARLHLPGKGNPSCPELARQMLVEVQSWFADRELILVGDGGYAAEGLLKDLPAGVTFVGRLRGDAAVYDPKPPRVSASKRGPKAKKGPRLPSPKEAARKADRSRGGQDCWAWQSVTVTAYGVARTLQMLSYVVVWPAVLGLRPIRIVVVRDPEQKMQDAYLFSTDVSAEVGWVAQTFAWRWPIEVAFKASKQVLDIEGPQHWCQQSIERLAPWVWSMQTMLTLWYLTSGHDSAAAEAERALMGEWDSEWSLRHMLKVLRRATLDATITSTSSDTDELQQLIETFKNYVNAAA